MNFKPWSRTTRILIVVGTAIGLIWLIIVINPLVQALAIAALLAYLFYPAVHWVSRRGRLSHVWAARVVYGVLLLLVLGIPAILSALVFSQFDELKADFIAAMLQFREWLIQPLELFGYQLQPLSVIDNLIQSNMSVLGNASSSALNALAGVTTNLLWMLTVVVSLYYFLVDGHLIKSRLVELMPPEYQAEFHLLIDEIDVVWRVFLRAQIIIFAIFIALLGSSMFAVVWLYRSQLLPLSPIGLIVLLVIVYAIVQNIDNVIVRPYFFGESLKLHPGLVFVGLIAGIAFGGLLGVIIAVPLIATAKVIGHYLHRRLLGLSPWPELEQHPQVESETEIIINPSGEK